MRLTALGWGEPFLRHFEEWAGEPDVRPGRVAVEFNYLYRVLVEEGELEAVLAGRLANAILLIAVLVAHARRR